MKADVLPPIGASASELVRTLPNLLPEVRCFEVCAYRTRPSMLEEIDRLVKPDLARLIDLARKFIPLDPNWRVGWLNIQLEPYEERDFEAVIDLALRHGEGDQLFPVERVELVHGLYHHH